MHRLLILVALALTPVIAFSDASSGTRGANASVVADANAYLQVEVLAPSVSVLNGYTANALRVTHRHVGAVTLVLTASETDSRFYIENPTGSIASGGVHAFRIKTDSPLPTGDFTVAITVSADLQRSGSSVGSASVVRVVGVHVS